MAQKLLIRFLGEHLMIWVGLGLYWLFPFADLYYDRLSDSYFYHEPEQSFTVLVIIALIYLPVSWLVIRNKLLDGGDTKLFKILHALGNWKMRGDQAVKNDLLFFAVKFFFIPLMVPPTWIYLKRSWELITTATHFVNFDAFFNHYLFYIILHLAMAVALGYYAFGYMTESRKLDNVVKSVDRTWGGWIVCLICYAPFFAILSKWIPVPQYDYVLFGSEAMTFGIRIFLVAVLIWKIWAIAILGPKCSNLTNRGIVTSGPYRYVRHPHYLAKIVFWWITALPYLVEDPVFILFMVFWSIVYMLRAVTEERHLLSDPVYRDYCNRVQFKFIPGIY